MTKVSIMPDNIEFEIQPHENILAAGLNNKLNLPHRCKNGVCGSCKCKIVSGSVIHDEYNKETLSDVELLEGYALLCKAHATTDVVLNIPNLLNGFPIKMLPAKVESCAKVKETAIIKLKTPSTMEFGFYAGQYIDILLGGKNRSYSIANSPANKGVIELHVKYHASGLFSEFVWNEIKDEQLLRFRGPLGNFYLQDTNNPIIFVCTGTGFAPVKAILEDMLLKNNQRPIHFYWGNRTIDDFYLLELLTAWQQKLNLKVTLCLSQEVHEGYRQGWVTDAIKNDFTDLSAYEVYACGNPKMTEDVFLYSTQEMNLDKNNFFSDAFTPSVV